MVADSFVHRLGFAVRIEDHFSSIPVGEALDVALDTREAPVLSRDGRPRFDDGTYRWADLADGMRHLSVHSPSGRWVRWDPTPVSVVVPIADPMTALHVEMWPTPLASAPPGVSAIRGKLIGSGVAGARVQIEGTGATPTGRFTFADESGELLYLLPGGPWPLGATGNLALTITIPGRTITSSDVISSDSWPGDQFEIPPQREMRVRFHVT